MSRKREKELCIFVVVVVACFVAYTCLECSEDEADMGPVGGGGYRRKGKCLPKARMEPEAWGCPVCV